MSHVLSPTNQRDAFSVAKSTTMSDASRKFRTRHQFGKKTRNVSERLIPLFERLANPDLLSRCMKLQTSNANESLHSTIWRRAPKSKYCGKKTTEIAVALAVMSYNKGAGALSDAVSSLGVSPGKTLLHVAAQLDAIRLRFADKAALAETKTSRKRRAMQKLQHNVKLVASEGVLYDAGGH